jgi:hypothetical protein
LRTFCLNVPRWKLLAAVCCLLVVAEGGSHELCICRREWWQRSLASILGDTSCVAGVMIDRGTALAVQSNGNPSSMLRQ